MWPGRGSCSTAPSSCLPQPTPDTRTFIIQRSPPSRKEPFQPSPTSVLRRCINAAPHGPAAGVFPPRNVLRGTTLIGGGVPHRCSVGFTRPAATGFSRAAPVGHADTLIIGSVRPRSIFFCFFSRRFLAQRKICTDPPIRDGCVITEKRDRAIQKRPAPLNSHCR